MGYGIRQPILTGTISVAIQADFDFTALDAAMNGLLPREEGFEPAADAAEAMVRRVLAWYHGFHRGRRTPVFPQEWQRRVSSDAPLFAFALPYLDRRVGADMVVKLVAIVNDLLARPASADVLAAHAKTIAALRDRLQDASPEGINSYHLMAAAHQLRILCVAQSDGIFAFGMGATRRQTFSTLTDRTPALGARIARRKAATAHVLRTTGLPVPSHSYAADEGEALRIAGQLGYPVVVKPDDQEQGRGVFAGITDPATLAQAYRDSRKVSKKILVEKHVAGEDFRFTVLNGEVIKIMKRRAAGVTGDGSRTIAELAAIEANSEASRRRAIDPTFRPLKIDQEALSILADRGLEPKDVLPAGEFVALRRRGNVSAGGTQVLVEPADVHEDNIGLAVRATQCLNLDLAGIDIILTDAKRSWLEAGGAVLEVNGMPQIGIDTTPKIYQRILSTLVRDGGRIPLHLVLCLQNELMTPERVAAALERKGCRCLSWVDGNWIDGRRATVGFPHSFAAARALLADGAVASAVIVMTPGDVMRFGLPFDAVDSVEYLGQPPAGGEAEKLLKAVRARLSPHIRAPGS